MVSNKADADMLLSTKSPEPKAREGQYTVHFSRESLQFQDFGAKISEFDLTMDLSPLSNIPVTSVPPQFWKTMHDMPTPTLASLRTRKLAVWYAQNCDDTEWQRTAYLEELSHHMEIDFPGRCLHNTEPASARSQFRRNADVYQNYLFVFGFHNGVTNDNIDEKFFQPFLGNSLNVVMAHDIAYHFAPGNHSFVDASRFKSPKELAAYLLHLRHHLDEYLTYFEYRKEEHTQPPVLAAIHETSIYQKGNLCRVCACMSDPKCLRKRNVTTCGYGDYTPNSARGTCEMLTERLEALTPALLPLSGGQLYTTRAAAAAACAAAGFAKGLCTKADLAGHSRCAAGWTSDWVGYWMEASSAGCGHQGYNTWSGPAGAYCCGPAIEM